MNKSIIIKKIYKKSKLYDECNELSIVTKQLYNVGLYELRQALFNNGEFLSPKIVYDRMKENENWANIPRKVSNQVWKQVTGNWSYWLKALKSYDKTPSKFTGKPKIPNYNTSKNVVTYEKGALNTRGLDKGFIKLSKTNIILNVKYIKGEIKEAKIIPKKNYFDVRVTYDEPIQDLNLDKTKYAGIDLGLNNIVSIATNQVDIQPLLVNGRHIKSINQRWNKKTSKLKSLLPNNVYSSNLIHKLTEKRNNKIDHELHQVSRYVVNWLIKNDIGSLVIGKNDGWKNKSKMGKKNNQNFIQVPHARLIDMIKYKFEQVGGIVYVTEESYTSKSSALDLDDIPKYKDKVDIKFSGKRVFRGLYETLSGYLINADINGSLNIIRKVAKNSIDDLVLDKQFIHHCTIPRKVVLQ